MAAEVVADPEIARMAAELVAVSIDDAADSMERLRS